MVDILREAEIGLHNYLQANVMEIVTYIQEDVQYSLQVTPARAETADTDDVGIAIKERPQAFIVKTDHFFSVVGGYPKRGDWIVRTTMVNGQKFETCYEVMDEGTEPFYRFVSRYKLAIRIHTKNVETEVK